MKRIAWIAAGLAAVFLLGRGAGAAQLSLDKQVEVPASLDEVWDAWTKRAGITSFFAPDAQLDPTVG